MTRLQRIAAVLLFALGTSLQPGLPPPAHAGEATQPVFSEHGLKAAFLLNFLQFMRWPADLLPEAAPLELCVASSSDFLRVLGPLAANTNVEGRTIRVRTVAGELSLGSCHALYLDRRTVSQATPFLTSLSGSPVLTVSDLNDFVEAGGMIQINTEGNKAFFTVSLIATEGAKLVVSARLLQLARKVVQGAH